MTFGRGAVRTIYRAAALGERGGAVLLLAPLALFLVAFYLVPLAGVLRQSLFDPAFTLDHYANLLRHPVYLKVVLNTLQISASAALACLLIGYPLAYGMTFLGPVWRVTLLTAVTLPFWISVLVRTYSWMIILGRYGVVNTFLQWAGLADGPLELMYNRLGVIVSLTYVLLPYTVLPLHSVMVGIDRDLIRAAESLGSTPWQSFRRVSLPLSLPGAAAGFLLTFIVGMGSYVTPALMGGRTDTVIAMSINAQLEMVNDWAFAGVLSVILLATVLVLLALCLRFVGLEILFGGGGQAAARFGRTALRKRFAALLGDDTAERLELAWEWATRRLARLGRAASLVIPARLRSLPWGRPLLPLACGLGIAFLIFPLCVIMPIAFSSDTVLRFPPQTMGLGLFETYFSSSAWMRATLNSLRVATPVMLLATVLGTLAAMGLRRLRGAARQAAFGVFLSPLIIPAIINAVAMYFFMAKLKLIGSVTGLVLAHLVVAVPFVVTVMTTTLQGVDPTLEHASSSLGAGRLRTFFHVTLPSIRSGLLTAAIFAFIASFDELIISLFVCGVRSVTLPKQMWDGIRDAMDPVIAAVAALLIMLAIGLTIVAALAKHRRA